MELGDFSDCGLSCFCATELSNEVLWNISMHTFAVLMNKRLEFRSENLSRLFKVFLVLQDVHRRTFFAQISLDTSLKTRDGIWLVLSFVLLEDIRKELT